MMMNMTTTHCDLADLQGIDGAPCDSLETCNVDFNDVYVT
jgi:hypothetical protein